ncbi:MAG: procyclic acidic repetitive family protein, partial [Proteobacteria bacterium]|nr:procyclic acidic repetitive family protein [Pseudomonadota bacterium]
MSMIEKLKSIFNTIKIPAAATAFVGASGYILGGAASIVIASGATFIGVSLSQITRNYLKKQAFNRYAKNKETTLQSLTKTQIDVFKIGVQSVYSTKTQLLSWFNSNVLLNLTDYYAGQMAAQQEKNQLILEVSQAGTKPKPKAETKPEPKAETKPETKPEPKAETKPKTKPEPKAETKPETKPE